LFHISICTNHYTGIYLPAKGGLPTRIGCVPNVRLTRAHTTYSTLLSNVKSSKSCSQTCLTTSHCLTLLVISSIPALSLSNSYPIIVSSSNIATSRLNLFFPSSCSNDNELTYIPSVTHCSPCILDVL
jgi:hypothetical protein